MHWIDEGSCILSPAWEAGPVNTEPMHSDHFSTTYNDEADEFSTFGDSSKIAHINVYENN
jgi:hypothetical protein